MCLAALALAFAYGGAPEARSRPGLWVLAGLLLGIVILSRPLYAGLLGAVAFAVPPERRRAGLTALAAGSAALILAATLGNLASRGNWTSYGGQRQSFYSHTGFPEVDPAAGDWTAKIAERRQRRLGEGGDPPPRVRSAADRLERPAITWSDGTSGSSPISCRSCSGSWRSAAVRGDGRCSLAVAFAAVCLFCLRPFNFYGGGGAIANRYFLPIYPASGSSRRGPFAGPPPRPS